MERALIPAIEVDAKASPSTISTETFDELVRRNQRRVYRVLLALTRNPDEADVLTQECFMRAYEKRSTFRCECSVGTWLLRIAQNLYRDHARNRKVAFWKRMLGLDEPSIEVGGVPANLPS